MISRLSVTMVYIKHSNMILSIRTDEFGYLDDYTEALRHGELLAMP